MMKLNGSTIWQRVALLCTVFCISLFSLYLYLSNTSPLSGIPVSKLLEVVSAEDEDVPAYVVFSTVYIGNTAINLQTTLLENGMDKDSFNINEVLYVDEERIWFTYEEIIDTSREISWIIASVDHRGEDLTKHHIEIFESENNAMLYRCENNLNSSYFQNKSGFYYNGNLILTDHKRLVEYNIKTGNVISMRIDEYAYPVCKTDVITQNDKLFLVLNGKQLQITTSSMCQDSIVHSRIMDEYGNRQTWSGRPFADDYFYGVQTNGQDYYIICNIMNWSGETYALVYSYNPYENRCSFCYSQFIGDRIHDGDFYIIPEYSQ